MNLKLILLFSIAFYVIAAGVVFLMLYLKRKRVRGSVEQTGPAEWMAQKKMNRRRENPRLIHFYQRSYVRSAQIPIFGKQVQRIRQRLAVINPYDEFTLRKETMRITYITLLITFFLILAFALFGRSLMVVLLGAVGCIVLNGMLIDVFVHRIENQLMRDFRDFLEDNRHQYQSTRMVDESIYEGAQLAGHDMKLHGERIHSVLTAKDPERALNAYYEVAPNRYLKVFTGVAYMIMEYGDKTTSKGSLYLNAISKFVQDINFDILRRNRLSYQLNSLTIIALAPILLSFPLQRWAEQYFPTMGEFYNGRLGYIAQITLYAVSMLAYLLIRKLAETEESKYIPKPKRQRWEKTIYEWKPVRFVVDRFVPSKHTKQYYKTKTLIKDSNSPLLIEWLFLRRILVSLSCLLVSVAFFMGLHFTQSHQLLYSPTFNKGGLMIGQMTIEEKAKAVEQTDFDRAVMEQLKGGDAQRREQARELVQGVAESTMNDIQVNNAVNRIVGKMQQLENEYFKWYELLISIGIGIIGYYAPIWLMVFQRRIRSMEMQNEVDQFRMLISILSQFDRMDVQVILEWLERFSMIFKPALQRCLSQYDSGTSQALVRLKEDAPYPAFVRLVERLENAVERITIQEAFDDLEMEQEYYREQKKETMDRLIENKASWGRDIGFAPIMLMLGAYIIVPFLYMSFMQMKDLIAQLSQI